VVLARAERTLTMSVVFCQDRRGANRFFPEPPPRPPLAESGDATPRGDAEKPVDPQHMEPADERDESGRSDTSVR
jgi:hypothetical protein